MKEIIGQFSYQEIPKGTILCHQGSIIRYMYFVEKGIARSFTFDDKGKEITSSFFREGMPMTLSDSFFGREPSHQGLEVLEDTVLYAISFDQFANLFEQYPHLEKVKSETLYRFLINANKRIIQLQYLSARERYEFLLAETPEILNRVPLGMVASYLGMSQETLS